MLGHTGIDCQVATICAGAEPLGARPRCRRRHAIRLDRIAAATAERFAPGSPPGRRTVDLPTMQQDGRLLIRRAHTCVGPATRCAAATRFSRQAVAG